MHIRISTLLKIFVALVVAALVTVYAILRSQDFNDFKPLIAEQVERVTGRKLVGDGSLDLKVSFTPSLAVSGVRFANADWGSRPHMLSIESLDVRVALLPLLAGKIDVEQILLSGVDILVETDANVRANYQFNPPDQRDTNDTSGAGNLVIPIIRDMRVTNATLTYRDGASGRQLQLVLDELAVFGQGPQQPLEVHLAAALNDIPVSVRATVGSPAELLKPSKPWPLDAMVEFAGSTATLIGTIAEPAVVKGLDLRLGAMGSEIADLSKLAGVQLPTLVAFRVAAQIRSDAVGPMSVQELDTMLGDAGTLTVKATGEIGSVYALQGLDLEFAIEGTDLTPLAVFVPAEIPALRPFALAGSVNGDLHKIALSGLKARIGESHLAGKIELATDGTRPRVTGLLTSQHIDLADLPVNGSGGEAVASDRVFSDAPLPLDLMRLVDAELSLQIDALVAKGMFIENLSAGLALQDGDLVARDIAFRFSGGRVAAAARFDAGGSTPTLAATLKARNVDLGVLVRDITGKNLLDAGVSFDADVSGRGGSPRQIMASLSGSTRLVVGEGRAKTDMLDLVVGGPTQLVSEFFKGGRADITVLNCVVSQFDITDGLATSKVLLADTEHARITGGGTVNLADETLKLRIDPRPKSITLNAAVPILIGGTLARPSYSLEKTAVVRKLGGLVGSLLFPPALIAGFAEFGVDDDSPCLTSAAPAKQSEGLEATQKPTGIKDAVKGLGKGLSKGIKGLLGQ